jgi:hypothetical protein
MKWIDKQDPDGNRIVELENNTLTAYFFSDANEVGPDESDGIIVDNHTNSIMTWNSIGVTHLNFQDKNFTIMITDGRMTLSYGDDEKNMFINVDDLIEVVKLNGKTMEELIKEEESKNGESEQSNTESDNGATESE